MKKFLIVYSFVILGCSSPQKEGKELIVDEETSIEEVTEVGNYKLFWYWEDDFNEEEQAKLKKWILDVDEATHNVLGTYPFDIHYHFHRSRGDQVVSFGHTARNSLQGVYFYVNPDFSEQEFHDDWTAPHEISHLAIPFVGRNNKWFSEGFATYFSRQIMIEMGCLTQEEFDSMYFAKIQDKMKYYNSPSTFVEVSDSLQKSSSYGAFYWGGSSFFLKLDQQLKEDHATNFCKIIASYQSQNRMKDKSLRAVIRSFDKILGDDIFSSQMRDYRSLPSNEVMQEFL
jgi:hypothetical protein